MEVWGFTDTWVALMMWNTHDFNIGTSFFRHIGDLGNVQVKADGTISATKTDTVALLTGDNPILGQPIVVSIHAPGFVMMAI